MSEDLLLELETATPISNSLEDIEDLVRVAIRQAGSAVESMKGSVRAFEHVWQSIIVDVAKGQTAEMQAIRARLLKAFETRLDQLKRARALVAGFSTLDRRDLPDPQALVAEIEGMERLKARVFDRWHSADDLERLAVEHYPLTQARLKKIAATHAPPAEWYQGEEERLFQD
jgi:hypothetical protein